MSALRLMGLGLALAGTAARIPMYQMPVFSYRPAYSRGPSGVRKSKRDAQKRRNRMRARGH